MMFTDKSQDEKAHKCKKGSQKFGKTAHKRFHPAHTHSSYAHTSKKRSFPFRKKAGQTLEKCTIKKHSNELIAATSPHTIQTFQVPYITAATNKTKKERSG